MGVGVAPIGVRAGGVTVGSEVAPIGVAVLTMTTGGGSGVVGASVGVAVWISDGGASVPTDPGVSGTSVESGVTSAA